MFCRAKVSGSNTYIQIVENHREGNKVRQRVIATLGRLDHLQASGALDRLLQSACRIMAASEPGDLSSYKESGRPYVSPKVSNGASGRSQPAFSSVVCVQPWLPGRSGRAHPRVDDFNSGFRTIGSICRGGGMKASVVPVTPLAKGRRSRLPCPGSRSSSA